MPHSWFGPSAVKWLLTQASRCMGSPRVATTNPQRGKRRAFLRRQPSDKQPLRAHSPTGPEFGDYGADSFRPLGGSLISQIRTRTHTRVRLVTRPEHTSLAGRHGNRPTRFLASRSLSREDALREMQTIAQRSRDRSISKRDPTHPTASEYPRILRTRFYFTPRCTLSRDGRDAESPAREVSCIKHFLSS